ncbi:MAG TPA: ATP-binding protein [Rectinemataceae bacterium]|nr:ATP-binding protein [Rectinemataceae bacterium]
MASILRRSVASFVPTVILLTFFVILVALAAMDGFYGDIMGTSLGSSVRALAAALPPDVDNWFDSPRAAVSTWAKGLDSASGFRVTLMRTDGIVVADSRAEPATMENHGKRPEMRMALEGGTGIARRTSATLGRELFYAAQALSDPRDGRIRGVLRIAVDLPTLRARLAPARNFLLLMIAGAGLSAVLAAIFFARGLTSPLRRLSEAALAYGRSSGGGIGPGPVGAASLPRDEIRLAALASGPDELRALARALDAMVGELENFNKTEILEGRERAAILDGMSEAVLALDASLALRTANRAARRLFGLSETGGGRGMPLVEATRSVELATLASDCREGGAPLEREFALYGKGGERWFRALATPFSGVEGEGNAGPGGGLVLVLDDITQVRRLERVRRDFVANVSHELRTPVQVIKGFAETLAEGALADPEKSQRFVDIIGRNALRMENLIADLLALARLEQEAGAGLELKMEDLASLVDEAVDAVAPRAEAKDMPIEREVEAGLRAKVHGGLVVQALVNLLDNAVKYTPAGSSIELHARMVKGGDSGSAGDSGKAGPTLLLEVRDRGPGIPARDIPRLFERFYTVDKARSRELGGTGLGLAIVKHIALAHGGEAGVESWEGEGSRFWMRIPLV